MPLLWWAWLATLAACEADDAAGPAAVQRPGTGPSTLRVVLTVSAVNRTPNAVSADDFDTYVTVDVTRDGERVPDALVSLGRPGREAPDVLLPGDDERYHGDHVGYEPRYTLDVEAGLDVLAGVEVLLPAVHRVTAPADGASVSATADLPVLWDAPDTADYVVVDLGTLRDSIEGDPSSTSLAAADLAALLAADPGPRELRVERGVRFALEGGAAGSRVFASVRNGLRHVTVVP